MSCPVYKLGGIFQELPVAAQGQAGHWPAVVKNCTVHLLSVLGFLTLFNFITIVVVVDFFPPLINCIYLNSCVSFLLLIPFPTQAMME